jgi:hypothetical protein
VLPAGHISRHSLFYFQERKPQDITSSRPHPSKEPIIKQIIGSLITVATFAPPRFSHRYQRTEPLLAGEDHFRGQEATVLCDRGPSLEQLDDFTENTAPPIPYDNDSPFGPIVWLDYTQSPSNQIHNGWDIGGARSPVGDKPSGLFYVSSSLTHREYL